MPRSSDIPNAEGILLLDPNARAGRTGHRFSVKTAKSVRMEARHRLGNSREDLPSTLDILAAAKCLSALLYDATEGDARLMVELDGEYITPAAVLSTLVFSL
jgi:hypothetical protein